MASSSSSAMHFSEQTSDLSCQTEPEMESAQIQHWTNLSSRTSSQWSVISNFKHYDMLKAHPQWGRFFRDFHILELGRKIGRGAQADVYEARATMNGPFNLVAKVMGDAPLQDFQAQWPIGMLSAYNSKDSHVFDLPLMTILGGTVLTDSRYRGRFAFIMYRRWGDLRTLIDRRMKRERKCSTIGPFFMDQVIQLMSRIAEDMHGLHTKHDIIHRDLKASNVLVWGNFGDDMNVVAPSQDEKIGSVVADFESSVGVLGTRWWRAPEILRKVRERVPSSDWQFTRESDVYSYGMTCYEIVTGRIPFEGGSATEASHEIVSSRLPFEGGSASEASHEIVSSRLPYEGASVSEASDEIVSCCLQGQSADTIIDKVLDGWRPDLPVELPSFLRSIIVSCWQSDPDKRPNFFNICKMLKYKQGCNPANVVIDNESNKNATIVKVEHWGNLQPLPLILGLERLLQMQLCVSKAEVSQMRIATGMVVHSFEVTDGKGRKVSDGNIIANIVKVLSLPVKIEWIVERSEDADTTSESCVLHIMSKTGGPLLHERISALLPLMKIRVYKVRFRSHSGYFELALSMDASNMRTIPSTLEASAPFDCKIVIRELASRFDDWDLLNGRLSKYHVHKIRKVRIYSTR